MRPGVRLLISILTGTPPIGSIFYYSVPSEPYLSQEEILSRLQNPTEKINEFLKIGSTSKELKDLVKDYLKTLTGARTLSKTLTSSLLFDFINSLQPASASSTKDKLKSVLSYLTSESSLKITDEKQKKNALRTFEGDDSVYQRYHTLSKLKKGFIDGIFDYFDSSIKESSGAYTLNNTTSPDKVLKFLGGFLDLVLWDYVQNEKPLPIKKITWNYDSNESRDKIEALFEKFPKNYGISITPSYFFPVFSEDTNKKFGEFLKKIKDSKDVNKLGSLDQYSDSMETDLVLPITDLLENRSSQFVIAALELYNGFLNKKSSNEYGVKNLSKRIAKKDKNICSDNGSDFPEIEIKTLADSATDAKLEKVFCIEKDKNPFEKSKQYSDFFFLKYDGAYSENNSNWIVFKDKNGVHAMTLDTSVIETNIGSSLIKLYKKEDKKLNFDLRSQLKGHLEKHFERLFLQKWNSFYTETNKQENRNGTSSNGNDKFKEIAPKLKEVLESDAYRDYLVKLRTSVLKDYYALLDKKPVSIDGTTKEIHPSLGFAGKFPFQPGTKILSDSFNYQERYDRQDVIFDFLERTFLAKLNFNQYLTINPLQKKKVSETLKEYSSQVDTFFNSNNGSITTEKITKEDLVFYKFKNGSTATTTNNTKTPSLEIHKVLNHLWLSMLDGRHAVEYLIQDKLKDQLKFFDWNSDSTNRKFKDSSVTITGDTKKDLFTGENDELYKIIIKNYLLHKHSSKFITSPDPNIYGTINYSDDFSDTDKLLKLLKKIDKTERDVTFTFGEDIMSPEMQELFQDLIAINYLAENKFENLRKVLRSRLSKDRFSAFLFSREYEKDGLCVPSTDEPTETDAKGLKFEAKRDWTLNNKYLGWTNGETFKPNECLKRSDLFNFGKVKITKKDGTPGNDPQVVVGYKGLVSQEGLKELLPEEIIREIVSKSVIWKDLDSLIKYVDTVNSEKEFEELVNLLKSLFPTVNWSIMELDLSVKDVPEMHFNWRSGYASIIKSPSEKLSLQQRQGILKGYLSQTDKTIFNPNASWNYLSSLQKRLISSGSTKNSVSSNGLINSDSFKHFTNWVKDKDGMYVLTDSNGNKHMIYMTQIKYDDVNDKSSWESYLKTASADLIIKELIKFAKNKSIKQKAIYYHLHESATKIEKFSTGDDRLRRSLDIQWLKGSTQ